MGDVIVVSGDTAGDVTLLPPLPNFGNITQQVYKVNGRDEKNARSQVSFALIEQQVFESVPNWHNHVTGAKSVALSSYNFAPK